MRAEGLGPRAKEERRAPRFLYRSCWALGPGPLALLFFSGCATLPLPGGQPEDGDLIAYAASLTRMEAEQRQQALTAAQRQWRLTGDSRDRARLGLAYGQWGHDGHDPAAAARNLHGALAAVPADWRQGERGFLETRAAQLAYLAGRESELADAQRETARLRQALDDAERKLRAITAIERNLDDRNGPR